MIEDDDLADDSLPKVRRPAPRAENPAPANENVAKPDVSETSTQVEPDDPSSSREERLEQFARSTEADEGEKNRGQMRHVPAKEWFVDRVDRDLRAKLDTFYQIAFTTSHENHEIEHQAEEHIMRIVRQLRKSASLLGYSVVKQEKQHIRVEIENAMKDLLSALEEIDAEDFGKRASSQSFHGSPWEKFTSSWLIIEDQVQKTIELLQTIDPDTRLTILEKLAPPEARSPADLEAMRSHQSNT